MEYRATLDQLENFIVQMETQLEESRAYGQKLERLLADAGVEAPLPPPDALKVFPDIGSIEWERWPDTADTWARFPDHYMRVAAGLWSNEAREKGFHLPWRNVIVEKYGNLTNIEVRRGGGGRNSPDFVRMIAARELDVTGPFQVALVQPGDDNRETDVHDREALAANYQGGINQALSTWLVYPEYAPYAKILAAARPDLLAKESETNRIRLTEAG